MPSSNNAGTQNQSANKEVQTNTGQALTNLAAFNQANPSPTAAFGPVTGPQQFSGVQGPAQLQNAMRMQMPGQPPGGMMTGTPQQTTMPSPPPAAKPPVPGQPAPPGAMPPGGQRPPQAGGGAAPNALGLLQLLSQQRPQ
jgi:hypothetical protein